MRCFVVAFGALLPLAMLPASVSAQQPVGCASFTSFPLVLNLGAVPTGAGGESFRCLYEKSQAAINALAAQRGAAGGIATLGVDGKLTTAQLPALAQGPAGPAGPQGSTGPAGPVGPTGALNNGAVFVSAAGTQNAPGLAVGEATTGWFLPASGRLGGTLAGTRFMDVGAGQNAFFGKNTGQYTSSATENAVFGEDAGGSLGSGSYNALFGRGAGSGLTSGSANVAIGRLALSAASTSNNSVAIGTNTLRSSTSGENIGIGASAGLNITTGTQNIAIGQALGANVSANGNMAIGYGTLLSTTGGSNTAVGTNVMSSITTGYENVGIGHNVAPNATDWTGGSGGSIWLTAVGTESLYALTTGPGNSAFGLSALHEVTTGGQNTGVGFGAGGGPASDPNAHKTGSYSTFLGAFAEPATPTQHSYMTVVGARAVGDRDNAIFLGRSGTDAVIAGEAIIGPNGANGTPTARTFATLPACNDNNKGMRSFITDAPGGATWGAAAAGGGSATRSTFCAGASGGWTYGG